MRQTSPCDIPHTAFLGARVDILLNIDSRYSPQPVYTREFTLGAPLVTSYGDLSKLLSQQHGVGNVSAPSFSHLAIVSGTYHMLGFV